uniref:Uncharacterized protein n=1 Tax=Romanomermis culicivorax TaxID=13658 RepID=A0A915KS74_ROMCU
VSLLSKCFQLLLSKQTEKTFIVFRGPFFIPGGQERNVGIVTSYCFCISFPCRVGVAAESGTHGPGLVFL